MKVLLQAVVAAELEARGMTLKEVVVFRDPQVDALLKGYMYSGCFVLLF